MQHSIQGSCTALENVHVLRPQRLAGAYAFARGIEMTRHLKTSRLGYVQCHAQENVHVLQPQRLAGDYAFARGIETTRHKFIVIVSKQSLLS